MPNPVCQVAAKIMRNTSFTVKVSTSTPAKLQKHLVDKVIALFFSFKNFVKREAIQKSNVNYESLTIF